MVSSSIVNMKRFQTLALGVLIALLALAAATGAIMLSGTKTGVALALLAVLGPVAAWSSIFTPLVFPFGFFVVLVPFDNLLAFSSFGTITKAVAVAAAAVLVLYLIRTRRFVMPDITTFYWGVFASWSIASMLWTIDPAGVLPHLGTFLELVALYLCISMLPVTDKIVTTLSNLIVGSGVCAALYGAYIFHAGMDVSRDQRLWLRNDETAIDPNHFAAALILPAAIALTYLVSAKRLPSKIYYGCALLALGVGFGVAASRGGLIALGAVLLTMLFRSRHRIWIGAIGALGAVTAILLNANVLSRFDNAASSGGAGREDIWRVGLVALRESPIVGQGYGSFPYAYDRAFLSVPEHYYTKWHRDAHNVLISTAVELGIFGVVVLALALVKQVQSLRVLGPESTLYELRPALESATVGIMVASIFLDTMTSKYFWLVPILIALARNSAVPQGIKRESRVPPVLQTSPEPR